MTLDQAILAAGCLALVVLLEIGRSRRRQLRRSKNHPFNSPLKRL